MGQCEAVRFIPTVVGNSFKLPSATTTPPVHPHGRGEQPKPAPPEFDPDGSSPRSWGTDPPWLYS